MSCSASDLCRYAVRAVAALGLAAAAGCANLRADLPQGFLELRSEGGRQLKAMTADDARLWIRDFDVEDGGDLDFWTAALRTDLIARRGLVPIGEVARIEDGTGRTGTLQLFEARVDGADRGYLCALWVRERGDESSIRTAEFTAPRPRFDELLTDVRAALGTVRD
ncbi:MAG: hypothetical protein IPM29_07145 [Planctomycetes bacterium]|nr:hypothetical protein [Planctomycetota bacterium]